MWHMRLATIYEMNQEATVLAIDMTSYDALKVRMLHVILCNCGKRPSLLCTYTIVIIKVDCMQVVTTIHAV